MRQQKLLTQLLKPELLALVAAAIVFLLAPRDSVLTYIVVIIVLTVIAKLVINYIQRDRTQPWTMTFDRALGISGVGTVADETGWSTNFHLMMMVASIAVAYIGQLMIFYEPINQSDVNLGYTMLAFGVIIFFAALMRLSYRKALLNSIEPLAAPKATKGWNVRLFWLSLSLLLMALLAHLSEGIAPETTVINYLLGWIPALVFLAWAFYTPPSANDEPDSPSHKFMRWEYVFMGVLFVGALLTRTINLGGEPHPFDGDEANFAQPAVYIVNTDMMANPFAHGFDSYSVLHPGLMSISMKLLGANHFAARLPSALMGTLTVIALYLLARELFGWQIAVMSGLFMMSWTFHIHFSRLALNQAGDPLFGTLAFYFLMRGLRRSSGFDYALSGMMLGLAQMFYLASTHFIVVMIAFIIFLLLFQRRVILRQWKLLLIIPFAMGVTLFPRLWYLRYTDQQLTYHVYPNIILGGQLKDKIDAGEDIPRYLLDQVSHSYLALFSYGDTIGWFGRGSNLMSPIGGPLLLVGTLIILAVVFQRPHLLLPLLWGAAGIFFGGTLTTSPPTYQRLVSGSPPLALLVGIGAGGLTWGISRLVASPERRRMVFVGIGSAIVIAGLAFYLGVHVRNNNYLKSPPSVSSNRAGESMAAAYDAGKQVVLVDEFATGVEPTPLVKYIMANRPYVEVTSDNNIETILAPQNGDAPPLDYTKPFVLVVPPERQDEAWAFVKQLPNAKEVKVTEVPMGDIDGVSHYIFDIPGTTGEKGNF